MTTPGPAPHDGSGALFDVGRGMAGASRLAP